MLIEVNGRPIPPGRTVTADHTVKTFTVTVRSMGAVGPTTIKDLIEKKLEVVSVEEVDSVVYVRAPNR